MKAPETFHWELHSEFHLVSSRLQAAQYVVVCIEALSGLDVYAIYYILSCNPIPHVLCSPHMYFSIFFLLPLGSR